MHLLNKDVSPILYYYSLPLRSLPLSVFSLLSALVRFFSVDSR